MIRKGEKKMREKFCDCSNCGRQGNCDKTEQAGCYPGNRSRWIGRDNSKAPHIVLSWADWLPVEGRDNDKKR
jgi:hypothetical protein